MTDTLIFIQVVFILPFLAGCSPTVASAPTKITAADATASAEIRWDPTFVDINGKELRLAQDPSTKAVVLIFILADCPIANSYIPELNRLQQSFSLRGIRLLVVHTDASISAQDAREHAAQYQIEPSIILDPQHDWVKTAGATISPEAVVFSPTGEILYRGRIDDRYVALGKRRGAVTAHDLRDALEAILADQPVPRPQTEAVGCLIPPPPSGQ